MAHILLVEDEPDTRYALAQVLSSAGHEIVEAGSAADAAQLLAGADVDLLVCELQLSGGQAPGILDEARKRKPRLDVIAICGGGLAGSARHVEAARAAGVAAVLHKPFDSETLVAVAEHLLGHGRRAAARASA